MKRKNKFSDWREDLIEINGIPEKEAMSDVESEKEITEKKVKNKIVINPEMKEAFAAIGGEVLEIVELDEKIDIEKADMGDVVDDFYKSDAPQFKGKSKKKRREMAIAAKLSAEDEMEEGHCMSKTSMKNEAVYGGEPEKKKDARMTITNADKKANTPAYQKFKAGDKRYKAAGHMGEETEDSLRDKRMERGGVDGNYRYDKSPVGNKNSEYGKKKRAPGPSAFDVVKAQIRAKHGDGAIIDTKKK
jgi:phage pi2 protein 07